MLLEIYSTWLFYDFDCCSHDRMCLEVEAKEKELQMKEEVHQRERRSLEEEVKRREEAGLTLQEKIDKLESAHQDSHDSLKVKVTDLEKSNGDLQMQVKKKTVEKKWFWLPSSMIF